MSLPETYEDDMYAEDMRLMYEEDMRQLHEERMKAMKGYKIFGPDWTCIGFKYEVGKVYEIDTAPEICNRGFHFCKKLADCFYYYSFDSTNKAAEVVALGEVVQDQDQYCTNKIKIVREITWNELLSIVNSGSYNSGWCNSGNHNSGNFNSGNHNSGSCNSGSCNSGWCNSGEGNSGRYNSGWCNSGSYNSGNHNSGSCNSGEGNSGSYNSGSYNSGWCNSGSYNSGDYCTGDFNLVNHETGSFCTEDHKIRLFDKESDMTFTEWRNSEAYNILQQMHSHSSMWIPLTQMTYKEKAKYPECTSTGGYLKIYNIKDISQSWWDSLNKRKQDIIKNIPNFDPEKFFQITGIRV